MKTKKTYKGKQNKIKLVNKHINGTNGTSERRYALYTLCDKLHPSLDMQKTCFILEGSAGTAEPR